MGSGCSQEKDPWLRCTSTQKQWLWGIKQGVGIGAKRFRSLERCWRRTPHSPLPTSFSPGRSPIVPLPSGFPQRACPTLKGPWTWPKRPAVQSGCSFSGPIIGLGGMMSWLAPLLRIWPISSPPTIGVSTASRRRFAGAVRRAPPSEPQWMVRVVTGSARDGALAERGSGAGPEDSEPGSTETRYLG